MYHQSDIANSPVRKYVDSVPSINSIGLYRKNNPNPKYNLISSQSLQSESGLSKSFQAPLKSLRYRPSIDSSSPETSKDSYENCSQISRNKSRDISLHSPKYENQMLVTTRKVESPNEAGLLTPSTRFNLNFSPKLYADINSPGFCGRVAEKLNETMTHQPKYSSVGTFPMVNLNIKTQKPYLSHRNSQAVAKPAVRVRIAPPDMSLDTSNSSILRHTSIGSDESMKSVLQVLREISRKRIHSQEIEDEEDNTKRIRTSENEDTHMEEQFQTDQLTQGKRPREESPHKEEVKRRRQFLNNEILSSLSSSMDIQPPHLERTKKRKAYNVGDLQYTVSSKEKLIKFQTAPTSPSMHKQVEIISNKNKDTTKEAVRKTVETVKQVLVQHTIETPNLKSVISNNVSPVLPKTEKIKANAEDSESPRIFGRFLTSGEVSDEVIDEVIDGAIDKVKDKAKGKEVDKALVKKRKQKNGMSMLVASSPKEQRSRLKQILDTVEGRDELETPHKLKQKVETKVETTMNSFISNIVPKQSPGILNLSSQGGKLPKSVSFSDPIAVTKVINDSEPESASALSDINQKSGSFAFSTPVNSSVTQNKDQEKAKESLGSPVTTNLSSGFNLNKPEPQTFNSPSISSSPAPSISVQPLNTTKPSVMFSATSTASPKSIFSFNSTGFKPSFSTANPLNPTSLVSPATQTTNSTDSITSPFGVSSTFSTSVSSTNSSSPISFPGIPVSNPLTSTSTSTPALYGSVTTTAGISTSTVELPKTGELSFTPVMQKKESEKKVLPSIFGTNTSQSFPIPSGKNMFGTSSVTSSFGTSTTESKNLFSVSTASETITKPTFTFGSGDISDNNQNKPIFGNVFNKVDSTAADTSNTPGPFGNVFSPSKTQSNILLGGFGSNTTSTQSTASLFSTTTTTSSIQSQNPISVFDSAKQKSGSTATLFGVAASNPDIKSEGFGNSKPTSNGFSFTPVSKSSSNIFSNVFNSPTSNQSSVVSKPTPGFGGFGTLQTTATTTPSLFAFGSTASSNQTTAAFGSTASSNQTTAAFGSTTTITTTTPVFNFGSSSATNPVQNNTVFGAQINNTSQISSPFGTTSTPQTTLSFGAATPNSAPQTSAFGMNSTQKSNSFSMNMNPSQTFGVSSTNPAPLTNGTATNSSTFNNFGTSSTSPFTFGGSTTNSTGFNFGGGSSTSTPGFGTGVKSVTPAVNNPSNVFAFGQLPTTTSANTQLSFQFNASSSQPSPGGFNFNPSATTPGTNSFQMVASAPGQNTMFTLGSGTAAPRPKAGTRLRRK